jgi:hypothetical protein
MFAFRATCQSRIAVADDKKRKTKKQHSDSIGNVADSIVQAPVAEAIVRALLWGRSQFSVSTDRKAMDQAVSKFLAWVSQIEKEIETAITESALGTGYEDVLKQEVYNRLGIHRLSGAKILPAQITL